MIADEIAKARENIKQITNDWGEVDAVIKRMTSEVKVWPKFGGKK